jgi:hypothetical protein
MIEVEKDEDQAAFREGLFVRAIGRPLENNPYATGSTDQRLWTEGWRLIDTPRTDFLRYASPPRVRLAQKFMSKESTKLSQERISRKDARTPLFFPLYFALAIALGGFLLMMLTSIERLSR